VKTDTCEGELWDRNDTVFDCWNEHLGWCNHFNRGLSRMLAQTVRLILKGKETKFDRMWPISNSLFFFKNA